MDFIILLILYISESNYKGRAYMKNSFYLLTLEIAKTGGQTRNTHIISNCLMKESDVFSSVLMRDFKIDVLI